MNCKQLLKTHNMKQNIYKLLSNAKQGLFALAMTAMSGTAYSQASYTLNYTGGVQTLTLQPGTYSVECWGGKGGDGTFYSSQSPNNLIDGGRGGFSTGTFSLTSVTTLYIHVGGVGINTNSGNNPGNCGR